MPTCANPEVGESRRRGRPRGLLRQPRTPGRLLHAAWETQWWWPPALPLSPWIPRGSHWPPANLHSGPLHSTALHSGFASSNQSLKDNNARDAGGEGGAGPGTPRSRRVKGARSQCCEPRRRCAAAVFSKRPHPHLGFQKCSGIINNKNKPDFSFSALYFILPFFALFKKLLTMQRSKSFFFFFYAVVS